MLLTIGFKACQFSIRHPPTQRRLHLTASSKQKMSSLPNVSGEIYMKRKAPPSPTEPLTPNVPLFEEQVHCRPRSDTGIPDLRACYQPDVAKIELQTLR